MLLKLGGLFLVYKREPISYSGFNLILLEYCNSEQLMGRFVLFQLAEIHTSTFPEAQL